MKLLVVAHPINEGYVVEVPALPGCVTEAFDIDEVKPNARDAVLSYLRSIASSMPIAKDDVVFEIEV